MQALISFVEPVENGFRVAQVVSDTDVFEVAPSLVWKVCPDTVRADQYWYDPADEQFKVVPPPPPSSENQPITVEGAQTL